MGIEISRREVLNNIIRFKLNLLEKDPSNQREGKSRSYKVLLNRHTGDMQFAQKISSLEHHFPKKRKGSVADWKEVRIVVRTKPREGVHFEMRDAEDRALRPADLEPLAWRIAQETVEVLNLKGREVKEVEEGVLPEEAALQDLSAIHLGLQKEKVEDLPGWFGAIGRIEAETVLARQPVGSYLLREADEIASRCAFRLAQTNRIRVHPYLLTFVERENKISDLLLLQTSQGWILYQDDPNLKDPFYQCYPSLLALLHALGARARHPMQK